MAFLVNGPLAVLGREQQKLLSFVRDAYAWKTPEELILFGTAILVGLGTGLGAVAFIWLLGQIGGLTQWMQSLLGSVAGLLLAMSIAGLIVGYVIDRWASEAKGHGVPEVMEAVALRGGHIRPRVAVLKVLASSITIGTGGSAGREGPIVQVGAALGSTVGQLFHFSGDRVRTLVACGAAAGIAATFNAPIAGAIFAQEVILNNFTARYFGMVVISGVAASIVSRALLGDKPAFLVPAYPMNHLAELAVYVVLGLLAACVAVLFIRVLYKFEESFDSRPLPLYVRTTVGMVLTGLVALLLPGREVLGPGLHMIGEAIAGDFNMGLGLMAALLLLKMLATSFTLGAGNSGGVFAPSLFMGAILGGIVGQVAHDLWPGIVTNPGAYAIVGMAAVFAGAARAPITAVLIVFEMSGDYKLILPLMLATVISTFLAEAIFKESIYTLKLRMKGVHLQGGRDVDIMQGVSVTEVMGRDLHTISDSATLTQLSDTFSQTRSHGLLVLDPAGKLWGIITVTDLDRAVAEKMPRATPVSHIGTPFERLAVAYPDETIGDALARMSVRGFGRLPVVARQDRGQLLGIIRRADIIKAYNVGLARRAELQHRTQRTQLRNLDGTEFVEVVLGADDSAIGKSIQEISGALPQDAILVSIRRNGRVLIPHGTSRFEAGDLVTAFIHTQDIDALVTALRQQTQLA
ncbi:MAG: chloride channel protein [Chloroflexi bacterium]|nr:chloride channel protein [Chloroflexota bacterium]